MKGEGMPAKKANTKKRRGRPAGSRTQSKPTVTVKLSRCPICGSTERTEYSGTRVMEFGGTDQEGNQFTHIVWRNTRCTECGQARVDKFHESRSSQN